MPRFLCSRSRRRRRLSRAAGTCVLLVAVLAPAAAGQEILPLSEVEPGQRGYGLSVFQGDRPERFEVEVLGVWRNVSVETSYILARLSGHGLETSGVVAGMSGSPVYLDEKLAGAVAFAWPFSREAVAGITPIETMRRLYAGGGRAGEPRAGEPRAAPAASLEQIAALDLPHDLLERGIGRLRSEALERFGSGLLWNTVGFGALSRSLLGSGLGSVAPAGAGQATASPELVPGGSVSGVLVDGDLRLAATGTVTDRDGDRVLAFGHSFLGFGELLLPMAGAEVITVLSSEFVSFKIANLGPVVGAFELDRAAGVRGRLGVAAPTVPMTVTVSGRERSSFELRLADLPALTPVLAAISVLGSLESASQAGGSQGLDLAATLDLGEHGELVLRQSFDGDSAALESAIYLLALTGFMVNNSMAEVDLRAVEVELEQHPRPRTARLVEAHASRTRVQPGDRLELNLDLLAYRGDRFRESLEIQLPTDLPDGRYSLLVGDGVSVDAARLGLERASPLDFRQALDLLRGLHSRRQVVVLGVFRGQGLAVAGETLPQLPGSVRSIWSAAGTGSAQPLRMAIGQEQELSLEMPVEGLLRVDLEVRRREPLAPGGDDGAPAGGGARPRPDRARGAGRTGGGSP